MQDPLSSSLLYKNSKIQTYNLSVILYECETWSLKLREEYGLSVFGSMVLSITFGNKRDEATGELRKLHKEEFCVKVSYRKLVCNKYAYNLHFKRSQI
jgi:nitrate/TMAO reductase-like tetraheme cytochrome c subunit